MKIYPPEAYQDDQVLKLHDVVKKVTGEIYSDAKLRDMLSSSGAVPWFKVEVIRNPPQSYPADQIKSYALNHGIPPEIDTVAIMRDAGIPAETSISRLIGITGVRALEIMSMSEDERASVKAEAIAMSKLLASEAARPSAGEQAEVAGRAFVTLSVGKQAEAVERLFETPSEAEAIALRNLKTAYATSAEAEDMAVRHLGGRAAVSIAEAKAAGATPTLPRSKVGDAEAEAMRNPATGDGNGRWFKDRDQVPHWAAVVLRDGYEVYMRAADLPDGHGEFRLANQQEYVDMERAAHKATMQKWADEKQEPADTIGEKPEDTVRRVAKLERIVQDFLRGSCMDNSARKVIDDLVAKTENISHVVNNHFAAMLKEDDVIKLINKTGAITELYDKFNAVMTAVRGQELMINELSVRFDDTTARFNACTDGLAKHIENIDNLINDEPPELMTVYVVSKGKTIHGIYRDQEVAIAEWRQLQDYTVQSLQLK